MEKAQHRIPDTLSPPDDVPRLRARLIWLSAQAACMRNAAATRALTPAERARLDAVRAESAQLHDRLRTARPSADRALAPNQA
jgi:hypothetical protein